MEYKKKGDLRPYLRRDEHSKKYPPGQLKKEYKKWVKRM